MYMYTQGNDGMLLPTAVKLEAPTTDAVRVDPIKVDSPKALRGDSHSSPTMATSLMTVRTLSSGLTSEACNSSRF
jgi:hypothetical protein